MTKKLFFNGGLEKFQQNKSEIKVVLTSERPRVHVRRLENLIPADFDISIISLSSFQKHINEYVSDCHFLFVDNLNNNPKIQTVLNRVRFIQSCNLSIIAITTESEKDIINSIRWGADECINISMSRERIDASLFARYRSSNNSPNFTGASTIEFFSNSIIVNGMEISLSRKEFALAKMLFDYAGKTIPRDNLCQNVWSKDKSMVGRSLDVHISRLREKLIVRNIENIALVPVYGVGYRLEIC